MIFVVVEELIPEPQRKYENIDVVTMATQMSPLRVSVVVCR